MFQVAIIGAGVSGLSAARLLQEKNIRAVVFEAEGKPGGLIKCDVVEGNLFHRVGGHVFNTKIDAVKKWFWEKFNQDTEFLATRRNAKIWMNKTYLGYPIENYIYQLPPVLIAKIVDEILQLQKQEIKDPNSYSSFKAFLLGNFGQTLYELYFKPYNEKIWKTDLSEVAMHWLEGKLPMPDYREILLSNILRKEEEAFVHSTFYYPRKGGSQFIADKLAEGLDIHCNIPVIKLRKTGSHWFINDLPTPYDHVIYTADIRKLVNLMSLSDPSLVDHLHDLDNLKSNGTSNLLCETDPTQYSWLYIPSPEIVPHRIIYSGNFSPENNNNTGRISCTVEFSGQLTQSQMAHEIEKLPGNLKIIASNYEPNSYVIQSQSTRSRIARIKSELKPHHFHLLGRFAEWEYYNMDKCMEAAMNLTGEIINEQK